MGHSLNTLADEKKIFRENLNTVKEKIVALKEENSLLRTQIDQLENGYKFYSDECAVLKDKIKRHQIKRQN